MTKTIIREVFALSLIASLFFSLFLHPIDGDGDFFQHVNIGRFVFQNKTLPHYDDLTFTASGREYVGYAWLSGVIFYALYARLGPIAINILVLGTALFTLALLFWYLCLLLKARISSVNSINLVSFLTLCLVVPVVATRWPSRPEIFQYPLLLGLLIVDQFSRRKTKLIFLFPVLILLWANLYGASVILGLGVVLLMSLRHLRSLRYLSVLLLCLGAALVNGYGLKSVFFILNIPKMTDIWGDWAGIIKIISGPNFYGFPRYILDLYFFYLIIFASLAVKSRLNFKKYPLFALLALSLVVPFGAVRHRTLAVLLSAPMLAFFLDNLMMSTKIISGLYLFSLVLLGYCLYQSPPGMGIDQVTFSPKVIKFIKQTGLSGNVFNTQRVGSFLEYELSPQIKTFADTRDELFIGTGVLEEIGPFLSSGVSLGFILRKYKIDVVILGSFDGDSYRDLLHDPRWSAVYFDQHYLIFVPQKTALVKGLKVVTINQR